METINQAIIVHSPIGRLEVSAGPVGIRCLRILAEGEPGASSRPVGSQSASPLLSQAAANIQAYFQRDVKSFSLPLDISGLGEFQRRVLEAVQTIPWGHILTYAQLAGLIDQPGAARAVGTALARNPILLLIPCHRVIGSDQRMHGFASPDGTRTKEWLLRHEGHHIIEEKLLD
ncbi:MAG: methylated-DNA--[protein]-cysteine S-methyltransferase [Anaerolineaceae bacterium]